MKAKQIFLCVSLVIHGTATLQATNYYWDTNGSTAGSGAMTGTWGSDAFWTTSSAGTVATSAVTTTNADDLSIAAGTNGTTGVITVNATQAAHSLTFDDNVIVTLSGGTAISLGSASVNSGIFVTAASNKTINTAIVLHSAATAVSLSNTTAATFTVGSVTGSATAGTQTLTLNSTSTGNVTVGNVADGGGGGVVAINKTGNGLSILSGINTYTGVTTVTAGILQFANQVSCYNNNSSSWTATNIVVNAGATLAFNVGGAGQFTSANMDVIKALGSASGGFKSGSSLGFDTTGGNFSYGSAIGDVNAGANAIGLVKLGSNTLTLSNSNTYTGGTTVSAGTLALGHATNTLFDTAVVTINGGTLDLGGNSDTVGTVNLISGSVASTTGVLTGSSYAVQAGSISAKLAGSGALTKSTSSTVTLTGANTYTGVTTVTAGTLQFTNQVSLYNNNSSSWTDTNIVVNAGATLAFNVGGANQFTSANMDAIKALGTATGGLMNGSSIGFDTAGGNFSYASAIANPNAGANVIGLVKLGGNTLTLSGKNSYTGESTVVNGTVTLQGDQSAATGGWKVSTAVASGILTISPGASVVVASGKRIYAGDSGSVNGTINVGGSATTASVNNAGTLNVGYRGTLNLNNGADWKQSGNMSLSLGTTTSTASQITLNAGSKFEYSGTSNIAMNTSASSGTSNLTVNTGGLFITSKSFAKTTGVGASNLTINGGTIKLGADVAQLVSWTGGSGALNVTLGASGGTIDTNTFSTQINQPLQGTGSLTKSGAGTLTLSNTNIFTGATIITNGTLALGHASDTLANNSAVTVDGSSAVLAIAGNSDTVAAVTLKNGGSITGTGGTLTGASYAVESGSISANLAGSGVVFTKTTSGAAVLSGSNQFTGSMDLQNGTTQLTGSVNATTTLSLGNGANSGKLILGGAAPVNQEFAGIATSGSGLANAIVGGATSVSVLTVNHSTVASFGGVLGGGGANENQLALNKAGGGSLTLTGINTYTGETTVSAGTLLVNGELGNTAVSVTGGAIGGTGMIGGALTLQSGALFEVVDINDGLAVAGAISLFSGFGIDDLAGMNWGSVSDGTYTLITGALADGNFAQLSNNSLASAYDIGGGRKAYFQQGSLQLVVVPEFTTALLGGLGVFLLWRRRRE